MDLEVEVVREGWAVVAAYHGNASSANKSLRTGD